ncbi:MAG: ribosome silencing factor [Pseudanabaenaceae cyanobacterium SKYGB_i_bin29]|nr:ribosome silencing factor [Pseudanabaenaceae cyanobacterium SKYG29]MDW8422625.1 ribosome silencing factor [Pseudanabaenaceae cyanobacterium SKYGB_i_bin29]
MTKIPDPSYQMTLTAAAAAQDRKGEDIVILAVGEVSYIADYFLIVTGLSRVQLRAIAMGIEEKLWQEYGRQPRHSNNEKESGWILQDYGELIVHIMTPKERAFYGLELFWGHAPRIMMAQTA